MVLFSKHNIRTGVKHMKFVLIGAGQRGMIYAGYAHEKGNEITAVADLDPAKREAARQAFGIPQEKCFASADELLSQAILGEAAIIATMDRDHYRQAIPAMEKGYHLLLEKPISPVPEEAIEIEETARRLKRHVVVCHVLRYSPFSSPSPSAWRGLPGMPSASCFPSCA